MFQLSKHGKVFVHHACASPGWDQADAGEEAFITAGGPGLVGDEVSEVSARQFEGEGPGKGTFLLDAETVFHEEFAREAGECRISDMPCGKNGFGLDASLAAYRGLRFAEEILTGRIPLRGFDA